MGPFSLCNSQKFIQFQLTVNVAVLIINFVSGISSGDVPLNAFQSISYVSSKSFPSVRILSKYPRSYIPPNVAQVSYVELGDNDIVETRFCWKVMEATP
ncbi:hypothetical protein BRADI_1g32115v3 [Brachypodium distachyon]|uniref:Uncharacterized protein n=1 Tax=Brachypodium distachyon TaxID=15368 RepID=A0A0Q3RVX7_BRADI|nr:hypothetical protein BRADI_1g32115v3 [Brachypodium distachyon]